MAGEKTSSADETNVLKDVVKAFFNPDAWDYIGAATGFGENYFAEIGKLAEKIDSKTITVDEATRLQRYLMALSKMANASPLQVAGDSTSNPGRSTASIAHALTSACERLCGQAAHGRFLAPARWWRQTLL